MYGTGYYATGYYATGYYVGQVAQEAIRSLFTYETLIWEAREKLMDDDPVYFRYPDSMLISILNRALNDLNRIRPDAWYAYYGQYSDNVPEVTDAFIALSGQVNWTADFQPDIRFYPAVLDYVVGFVHLSEDDYAQAGVPKAFYNRFKAKVLST